MKKMIILFMLFSILLCNGLTQAAEENVFTIIVNASNPIPVLNRADLSKIFLKKMQEWQDRHVTIFPIDLFESSPIRQKFSTLIHGRKIASIKAYWQKQIFSGRGVPPEEKKTDRDVLKYVSENSGAIGYISANTDIREYHDVKEVEWIK